MKLVKMLLTPPIAAISVALGVATTALATNWYVSSDGTWDPESKGNKKATVKEAITAASAGDTIWVKDGTVIESGSGSTDYAGVKPRIDINKAVTLRSESGTAFGPNPVIIRGEYDSEAQPCKLWGKSMRCVRMCSGSTLVGIVLERGATGDNIHGNYPGGGAIYGCGTVTNCLIRNTGGSQGGAIYSNGTSLSDCLVVEDCVVTNNTAVFMGGASLGRVIFRRCNLSYNRANSTQYGGGAVQGASNAARSILEDCGLTNNVAGKTDSTQNYGGGARYVNAFRCSFVSNTAYGSGGALADSLASDCLFKSNRARSSGSSSTGALGGGLYECVATNCVIVLNSTSGGGVSVGYGGGGYNCDFYNCVLISNKINECYYSDYHGGAGLYCTEAHECVNTLFVGHSATKGTAAVSSTDPAKKVKLVNCTITGNSSADFGGCYNAVLVNSIVYGNKGSQYAGTIAATNSCAAGLSDTAKYPGCITTDPKFIGTGDHPYALSARSPCRDKGFYDADDPAWNWMTNPVDPRSKDLAGKPRLQGTAPDMGCYEFVPPGFLLLLR